MTQILLLVVKGGWGIKTNNKNRISGSQHKKIVTTINKIDKKKLDEVDDAEERIE